MEDLGLGGHGAASLTLAQVKAYESRRLYAHDARGAGIVLEVLAAEDENNQPMFLFRVQCVA